jgi:hypothetical protein
MNIPPPVSSAAALFVAQGIGSKIGEGKDSAQ